MKTYFLPKEKVGNWGFSLAVLMPVLFLLGGLSVNFLYSGVEAGNGILDDLRARPALAIFMLLGMLSGVVSFVLTSLALFRKHEHSVLVWIAWIMGLWIFVMLLGEILFPH